MSVYEDHEVTRWLEHAEDMRRQGNHDACMESLRRVLSVDPDHPGAHAMMALTLLSLKRLRAAEFEAMAALELDPVEPLSQFAIAAVLLARRKLARAEEHIDILLALEPDDPANYRLKAELRVWQNRDDEAAELLDEARSLDPDDPHTLVALAELAESRGAYAEAARLADEALTQDPEHADAHVVRGRLLLRAGQFEEAIEHALFALGNDAEHRAALELLAAIKAKRSRLLGLWWRFASMFDGLSEKQTIAVLLGSYLLYRLAVIFAEHFEAGPLAWVLTGLWLAFCAYTWIAPSLFRRLLESDLDRVELDDDF